MAGAPSPADLLDQAGTVFSLADELGRAFEEEHRQQREVIDPRGWDRHAPIFAQFCDAVLNLRDALQSPPQGFDGVFEQLLKAARIAKALRETMIRPEARASAAYLDSFPEFNSVAYAGYQAVKAVKAAQQAEDPFAFVDELGAKQTTKPSFTMLDQFPATHAGHVAFMEFLRDEVHYAAEAKRQQLEREYSNGTLERMLPNNHWAEAKQRVAELPDLPADLSAQFEKYFHWQLTIGSIGWVDEWLKPTVDMLRGLLLHAENIERMKNTIIVNTAGDLLQTFVEGFYPGHQFSAITLQSGANVVQMSHPDPTDESRRIILDRALALVTAEGGDKIEAMERLIARVQLKLRKDKANVINMPIADFVEAATGIAPNADSLSLPAPTQRGNAERPNVAAVQFDLTDDPLISELLLLLWDAPIREDGIAVVEIPERLREDSRIEACESAKLIQFARRNHCHHGAGANAKLVMERGWNVADLDRPGFDHAWQVLRDALMEDVPDEIRLHIQLAKHGSDVASRLAMRRDSETMPPPIQSLESKPNRQKPKRSTNRDEAQIKLVAALTKHHQYADGGCLNLESIGNNELAKLADVAKSTASEFLTKQFGGLGKYRSLCRNTSSLVNALKLLNNEFTPHQLYGQRPPNEDDRHRDS